MFIRLESVNLSPLSFLHFKDDGVRQVLEEIKAIFEENCAQA